jgi:tetratricopeptide (TPR) repeat protein
MISLAPDKPDYRLERIYADNTLGTVLMDQRRYREAAGTYQNLLGSSEALSAAYPDNLDYQKQISETLAWLADAREFSGQLDEALAHRQRQVALLAGLWRTSKGDTQVKRQELAARRSLSRLYASRGEISEAVAESDLASAVLAYLTKTEPENMEWVQTGAGAQLDRAELQLAIDKLSEARSSAEGGCGATKRLAERNRTVESWRTALQKRCWTVRAKIAIRSGNAFDALADARRVLVLSRTERDPVDQAFSSASGHMLVSDALMATGQREAAAGALQSAQAAWPKNIEETPSELALHAMLLARLGQKSVAIEQRLSAIGYRHPYYLKKGVER